MNREACCAAVHGVTKSWTRLNDWTEWHSAYRINKQGDNIQPWYTPFPIWNQPVVPCPVLTVASWPTYRFLKRQVRWSGVPISLRIFHSLLWSTQSHLVNGMDPHTQVSHKTCKVVWCSHLFKNFPVGCDQHSQRFTVGNEAVFLEFHCFFYDPTNVVNLISGSSVSSKSSLYIWKFSVRILLKPILKDFSITFQADDVSAIVW